MASLPPIAAIAKPAAAIRAESTKCCDRLPVRSLEPILDDVVADDVVAGTLAHYPTIIDNRDGAAQEPSIRDAWLRLTSGLVTTPLDFTFSHSLMDAESPAALREAPFYLNFGVVFLPRQHFEQDKRNVSREMNLVD